MRRPIVGLVFSMGLLVSFEHGCGAIRVQIRGGGGGRDQCKKDGKAPLPLAEGDWSKAAAGR